LSREYLRNQQLRTGGNSTFPPKGGKHFIFFQWLYQNRALWPQLYILPTFHLKEDPSSSSTSLKKGHCRQLSISIAETPLIESEHKVPTIFQQNRPAFTPRFKPLCISEDAAGQHPDSSTLTPLGSRPHFIYSQQFNNLFSVIFLSETNNSL